MKGFPEFDYVVVDEIGGSGQKIVARDLSDAFWKIGLTGLSSLSVSDGGDRVLLRYGREYGCRDERAVTFSLNGSVHLAAWEVVAAYERDVLSLVRKKGSVSKGFRSLPVKVRHWDIRSDFLAPRACGERRANHGLRGDEEAADLSIGVRAKRMFVYADKFERMPPKDRSWKRFRRSRWKAT